MTAGRRTKRGERDRNAPPPRSADAGPPARSGHAGRQGRPEGAPLPNQGAAVTGTSGARVVARLAAFLLLCIGVQIMSNGVQDLLAPVLRGVAASR